MWSLLSLFALAENPTYDISDDQIEGELQPPGEEEIGDEHSDLSPEANAEFVEEEPAPPRSYTVSDGSSHLVVLLNAPDGSKAHDHAVAATFVTGSVVWGEDTATSSIEVSFPVNGLVADTDELRAEAGFEDTLKEKHQAKVVEHMLAEDQLNEAAFGDIVFASTAITATDGGFDVTGDMTIRGVTAPVTCSLTVETDEKIWVGTGTFDITATQFGFEPYAFGKYFNADAMTVSVKLAAAN
ncbi:MAG: YceI family protein [Proteobacteria bacterium]|nr:YceI family protein [Pseudomonadota bacterium]MCP4919946.1 YceI family protein [Pseudomonadota bacterium]